MWVSGVLSLESALVISMSLAKSLKSVHWTCLVHWVETSPSWLPAMQIIQIKVTVGFLWDKDFCLLVCVERQIERQDGRENTHPLFCSPDVCNSENWTRPKPWARNSTQVPEMGDRNPISWAIFYHFPKSALDWNQEPEPELKSMSSDIGCRKANGHPNYYLI